MLRALLLVGLVAGCKEKAADPPAKVEQRVEPTAVAPPTDPSPAARQGIEVKPSPDEGSAAADRAAARAQQMLVRGNIKKVGVSKSGDMAAIPKRTLSTKPKAPTPAVENHVENKPQ